MGDDARYSGVMTASLTMTLQSWRPFIIIVHSISPEASQAATSSLLLASIRCCDAAAHPPLNMSTRWSDTVSHSQHREVCTWM
jgi:hypothetical protein